MKNIFKSTNVKVSDEEMLLLEKTKNADFVNDFINLESNMSTEEYIRLMLSIEALPNCFENSKKNIDERLSKFIEKIHSDYSKMAMAMYMRGYKEGDKAKEKIDKFIKLAR